MSEQFQYQPNAGQTYMPFQENTKNQHHPSNGWFALRL